MKTKLIMLLALATALFAGEDAKQKDEVKLSFTVGADTTTITARYLVLLKNGTEEILRIHELPYRHVINKNQNVLYASPYEYIRPTKPDEVKIELWTEDGQKWVARWEPAK